MCMVADLVGFARVFISECDPTFPLCGGGELMNTSLVIDGRLRDRGPCGPK